MSSDDPPSCRATIRGDRITLHRWTRGLTGSGPAPAGLGSVTAALADLRIAGDGEVIVTPVPHAPWSHAAEESVLRWAGLVGHRRVWLPGRVVDLGGELAALGVAAVDCPTCGAHWEDGALAFWESVRACGWFPATCLACGGSLPEWSVAGHGTAAATGADRAEPFAAR